jgi:hypothetical protein
MSYYEDATRAGVLMFGGSHDGTDVLGDTWLFFGSPGTWQRCVQGNGCPGGDRVEDRCCVGMLYDSARDRIVIFGGQSIPAPDAYRDLWVWTYGSGPAGGWVCISPVSTCNVETP